MSEIVSFHNALNLIPFSKFTEIERNLIMGILCQLKERGGTEVVFKTQYLRELIPNRIGDKDFEDLLSNLKNHFFNLHFETIRDISEKYQSVDSHHLFNVFSIVKDKETGKNCEIRLQVNPPFLYLVNDLVKDFTSIELQEFCSVKGKYAKDLYRLLKQFRTSGYAIFSWADFKTRLCVPEKMAMRDIDRRILEPAVAELSRPLDLIDRAVNKCAFLDLRYKKIQDNRKRGKPVTHIEFTFKREIVKHIKANKAASNTANKGSSIIEQSAQESTAQQQLDLMFGKTK